TNLGLGLVTVLIAHVMFSIAFVAVVVRARVLTLDPNLEEAARDLGANPFTTFWLVTFPMIFPAVLSGGLLAFALSIDDFVISQFLSIGASSVTIPVRLYSGARLAPPPSLNALATVLLALTAMAVITAGMVLRAYSRAEGRDDSAAESLSRLEI
ncbi:MAG TPA: ABC transporter permease subunit, partial [Acidimicrobiia bacterium]|nr:ABC transporter permease subunit [Acidimicrobiia bacterium]